MGRLPIIEAIELSAELMLRSQGIPGHIQNNLLEKLLEGAL